ncbi:uncharacterized protein A4U43_C03F13980 [Asparagus officinalis]|uniref:SS18 N-terminal domain-containing protein n=1 Tax=Asparagus officinalis TaxID=4686 RepID=A0A5P1FF23_ASPOF|nr:GRF1-interacting factor 2-like [Asparagus officinalis]ONK75160.1 uncharacterized protein A4U43_C03F13980 [Asparagus officinalis]
MQQAPPPSAHPLGPMGSVPPANITTEQIQKYLDENKQLILAILDNQNMGRLAECAQYQAQLQKNLLYLAAIADAQPQTPGMRPQMIPHTAMPQAGAQYMQQAPIFPPKSPSQFTPQQIQELQQQQQLHHPTQMMPFQGHTGMRPPVGSINGMHTESSHGGGGGSNEAPAGTPSSKKDAEKAADDGQKNSATEQGSGNAETPPNPQRPEGSKTP